MIDPHKFEELKATGQLPSPKGVALAIMQLTQREEVSATEIANLVKSDPALSGRIIKAANAANMAGRRPVASIPDAIVVLGISALRQLALGFSLIANYHGGDSKHFDYQDFWSRSLITGIAVQALAARSKVASPEETFIAGLLSRIGRLALTTLYPAEYDRVLAQRKDQSPAELAAAERSVLATDHNELTAALLEDWGIPKVLVDPVFHHENPDAANFTKGSRAYTLAFSLHLASYLAAVCLAEEGKCRTMLPELFLLGSRLGIEAEAMTELADEIVRDWQEWGNILNVHTTSLPPFAEMANAKPEVPQVLGMGGATPAPSPSKLRLLVVDDDAAVRLMLKKILGAAGHTVFTAQDGQEGLNMALELHPQLVITDWVMPRMDGISFCRALRETRIGRSIYLLILTSMEDEERLVEAFEAGADDFITKPFSPRVLGARLRAGHRVIQLQEEIEHDREELRRFAAELAITNRRLQQAALTDSLTGLHNRRYAMDRMDQEWAASVRSGRPLSCILIDVDRFKQVNDAHGHDAGDAVLKAVAEVLRRSARAPDVVSRIGGEEFLVICPDTDLAAAYQCAERLRNAVMQAPIPLGGIRYRGTISAGVATRTRSTADPGALVKVADQAVYAAKQAGRNRTCVFKPKDDAIGAKTW